MALRNPSDIFGTKSTANEEDADILIDKKGNEILTPDETEIENKFKEKSEIFEDLNAYREVKTEPEETKPEVVEELKKTGEEKKSYLTGVLLLWIVNIAIPEGIAAFIKYQWNKEINVKNIELSKPEKEELLELADAAAKQLMKTDNPVMLFFGITTVVYGIRARAEMSNTI